MDNMENEEKYVQYEIDRVNKILETYTEFDYDDRDLFLGKMIESNDWKSCGMITHAYWHSVATYGKISYASLLRNYTFVKTGEPCGKLRIVRD